MVHGGEGPVLLFNCFECLFVARGDGAGGQCGGRRRLMCSLSALVPLGVSRQAFVTPAGSPRGGAVFVYAVFFAVCLVPSVAVAVRVCAVALCTGRRRVNPTVGTNLTKCVVRLAGRLNPSCRC